MRCSTNFVLVTRFVADDEEIRLNKASEKIIEDIKDGMETTERDLSKNYPMDDGSIHNPSFPYNNPAVMYGNLKSKITHITANNPQESAVVMKIGVFDDDLGYGFYLEFGTKYMLPRPWLSLSMITLDQKILL
jgi:hypothetical protein